MQGSALGTILCGFIVMALSMGQALAAGTGCEDGNMIQGGGTWTMLCGPNDCPDFDPCGPYTFTHPGTSHIVTTCQCWKDGQPYSPVVTASECKATMMQQGQAFVILCQELNCPLEGCEDEFATDGFGNVTHRWCLCR